jgi:hypothetical protein
MAAAMAAQPAAPGDARAIETHLGALLGRLMLPPGGWVAGARQAGIEPLWTGRARPYDESTLRTYAHALAQHGGTDIVAHAVEASVQQAVADASDKAVADAGDKAVAYTDIFDQVYWTKKPSHAGPIGNRGNRLLAATYFGLTFVQPTHGPALAYALSWHKPASPLQDALEALYTEPRRATWLTASIKHHIWDRGGSGQPTLRWAADRAIPYLTVSKGSTHWTRYRRAPEVHTRSKLPVFVRRDAAVARGRRKGTRPQVGTRPQPAATPQIGATPQASATPQQVIFPACPDKGRRSTRALRYRTGAPLPRAALRNLDRVYKTRWPCNENPIKALVAVGFDRNLDRGLTPTTSRGTDGRLARLQAREQVLHDKIEAFNPTTVPQAIRAARPLLRQKEAYAKEHAAIDALPNDKGARMATGAEPLCKYLMLLMYNALTLLLWRSPLPEVQAMTPLRVHALLLGRSMLVGLDKRGWSLWIDPVPLTSERPLQEELVRLFNEQSLSVRGHPLYLRLHDPPG